VTRVDWELLHDLHYKAENLPIGPRFWKLTLVWRDHRRAGHRQPEGALKERHLVFPNIKPGRDTKITNTYRYKFINAISG
jgi:hypothetical protein